MADFPLSVLPQNKTVIGVGSIDAIGSELSNRNASISNVLWPTANRAVFVPFVVYRPFTVRLMGVVNASVAAGHTDVGVYDLDGARVVSSGSTVMAGTSTVQTFDVTDTRLLPGAYYMAMNNDDGTARFNGYNFTVAQAAALVGAMGVLTQDVGAVTLPNPATMVACTTTFVPEFFLSEMTVL